MSVCRARRRPQQSKLTIRLLFALPLALLLLSCSPLPASAGELGSESRPIRLLLLGQAGVGKTTFLDLLLWYAEVSNLTDPKTQADDASIRQRHNRGNENPDYPFEPQAYKVMLNTGVWFEILDTPAFDDFNGPNHDSPNSELIVESVRKGSYLNAILLVLKGKQTEVSPALDKILDEVLDGISQFLPGTLLASTRLIFTNVEHGRDLRFPIHRLGESLRGAPRLLLDNPFKLFASTCIRAKDLKLLILEGALDHLPELDELFTQLTTDLHTVSTTAMVQRAELPVRRLREELGEKAKSKPCAEKELKALKLQAEEERKKRDEADLAMKLRMEEESEKRAEAELQVAKLGEELREKEKIKKRAEDEVQAVKRRATEEIKERDEKECQARQLRMKDEIEKGAKVERESMMLREKLQVMEVQAEEERKKRAEEDLAMMLRVEEASETRSEAELLVAKLGEELRQKEKSKKRAEDELQAVKRRAKEEIIERDEKECQARQLRMKFEIEKGAKVERVSMMLRERLHVMKLQAEEEKKKRAEADLTMMLRAKLQVVELLAEAENKKRAKVDQLMELRAEEESRKPKLGPGGSASALETSIFARLATASAVFLLVSAIL